MTYAELKTRFEVVRAALEAEGLLGSTSYMNCFKALGNKLHIMAVCEAKTVSREHEEKRRARLEETASRSSGRVSK